MKMFCSCDLCRQAHFGDLPRSVGFADTISHPFVGRSCPATLEAGLTKAVLDETRLQLANADNPEAATKEVHSVSTDQLDASTSNGNLQHRTGKMPKCAFFVPI